MMLVRFLSGLFGACDGSEGAKEAGLLQISLGVSMVWFLSGRDCLRGDLFFREIRVRLFGS